MRRHATLIFLLGLLAGLLVVAPAQASTTATEVDPDSFVCKQPGFIDFENLPDHADLSPTAIAGVRFTTTGGYTWRVGDFAAGGYSGKYPNGYYSSRGTHWAWLGQNQGSGQLDFVEGPASYFSVLVSAGTHVVAEAYDKDGQLLETTPATGYTSGTGRMTLLEISRPRADMSRVVIHDSGNYFLVDSICTNAKQVTSVGRYTALGDSFSAGEGVPPFLSTTDVAKNQCHRSIKAYPYLVEGSLGVPQDVESFACSGALIKDFYRANHSAADEKPQINRITPETSFVTLSVGGNDVGFAKVVGNCVKIPTVQGQKNPDYDPNCQTALNNQVTKDIGRLQSGLTGKDCNSAACSLPSLYGDLRRKTPRSRILVVGYPNFVPATIKGDCAGNVRYESGGSVRAGLIDWRLTKAQTEWMHKLITRTNERIKDLATRAGMLYVDLEETFKDHEVCSKDPYLNGIVVDSKQKPSAYSFHPNAKGQAVMAEAVKRRVLAGAADLYLRPGESSSKTYAVGPGRAAFTATTSWAGSDMELTLHSPTGRVIDRATKADDVARVTGPTNESVTVTNPEEGEWTVEITALDVPDVGEAVRLDLDQRDTSEGPLAVIRATPDRGVGKVVTELDATASAAQSGDLAEYLWTFDDGSEPAPGAAVKHTFGPGRHTVKLEVTDDAGRKAEASQEIFVSPSNQAPTASLLVDPAGGAAPLEVLLDGSFSDDVDGKVVSYRWDFDGDGKVDSTTTEPTTTHTYPKAGKATPSVTVVDDLGATATAAADPVDVSSPGTATCPRAGDITAIRGRATADRTVVAASLRSWREGGTQRWSGRLEVDDPRGRTDLTVNPVAVTVEPSGEACRIRVVTPKGTGTVLGRQVRGPVTVTVTDGPGKTGDRVEINAEDRSLVFTATQGNLTVEYLRPTP